MALRKVKIGAFVEKYSEKCGIPDLTVNDVSGINKDKEFFEPSKQVGADTSGYKVVPPNYFACNLMHVGRDKVLPISMNHTKKNKIVSAAYTVFRITDESIILKEYFFMCLKSQEKDRYFWFNTDSSVRDGMDWDVFCNVEISVPSIDVQKKYVAVYLSMLRNLESYQDHLDDIKMVCDAYIENLQHHHDCQPLGNYVELFDERNDDRFGIEAVKGITTQKEFIETKANMNGVSLTNYKVVPQNAFAYVADTSRRGDKISLALNLTNQNYLVSSITTTFKVTDESLILPEYILMFMKRSEFDRYARYNSWGSARETIEWDSLCDLRIPVPQKEVQESIVKMLHAYTRRKSLVETIKDKLNQMCPVLIRGAIKEGGGQ